MLAAYLMAAVVGASAPCATDQFGACTDAVVRYKLSYDKLDPQISINAALGDVVSIEFPRDVGLRFAPALGNKAIFKYETQNEPLRILLWPKIPKGAGRINPKALIGERSNLQIPLEGGITITVTAFFGLPGESVQRLVFEFPEKRETEAYFKEKAAEQMRNVDESKQRALDDLAGKEREIVARGIGRAVIEKVDCNEWDTRTMHDLLVVRAKRVCQIGDNIFVVFSIKNRRRDVFRLGSVEVRDSGGGNLDAIIEQQKPGTIQLGFDGESSLVAIFPVEAAESGEFVIEVVEASGKRRVVTLTGVGF